MHDRRLELWFAELLHAQHRRIARHLRQQTRVKLDPGGGYTLTIKGRKPAQIRLEDTPDELHRKAGEIGRRINDGYFLSGS